MTRIDPRTDKVSATITVGGSPQAITVADGRVWVTVDAQTIKPIGGASGGGTLRWRSGLTLTSVDPAMAYGSGIVAGPVCHVRKALELPGRAGAAGGRLIPEVARSLPAVSADGKTYTFTIRAGFRFSPPSNQPVTAQTFKYTIERSAEPEDKSPAGARVHRHRRRPRVHRPARPHISGIVAHGDTLTIHLLAAGGPTFFR